MAFYVFRDKKGRFVPEHLIHKIKTSVYYHPEGTLGTKRTKTFWGVSVKYGTHKVWKLAEIRNTSFGRQIAGSFALTKWTHFDFRNRKRIHTNPVLIRHIVEKMEIPKGDNAYKLQIRAETAYKSKKGKVERVKFDTMVMCNPHHTLMDLQKCVAGAFIDATGHAQTNYRQVGHNYEETHHFYTITKFSYRLIGV